MEVKDVVYRFETYVPLTHVDVVKEAIAAAGAGKYGDYDSCMWCTKGIGQFRPLDNSNPFIGKHGELELVEEMKIECIVNSNCIKDVIEALRKAHPYETPAYQYWEVKIE